MIHDNPTDIDRGTDTHSSSQDEVEDGLKLDRRGFMKGAVASLVGAGVVGALSDDAAAAGNPDIVLVFGKDASEHAYEIEMEPGGSIKRARYGETKDRMNTGSDGAQRVRGSVWHWNVDSFTYTGEIDRVEANGSVAFHFPSGAFRDDERIVIGGYGSGDHSYVVGSNRADFNLARQTFEDADIDQGPPKTERGRTRDKVSGKVADNGSDVLTFERGQPLQFVHVTQGHLEVNPYDPTRELNQVTRPNKNAVIVYSYMGDGPFTTFFQNFTKLTEVMKGYDKAVLLKHKNLSGPAYVMANEVRDPTRKNFADVVRSLVKQDYTIDLFIMSHGMGDTDGSQHGSRFADAFKMSTGQFGSEDWFRASDIERLRASFQGNIPLRLVYQANCWGSQLNEAWRYLGATTSVGSRYVNFFPNQFAEFAKWWRRGQPVKSALNRANTRSSRAAVRKYLTSIDIPQTRGKSWAHPRTNAPCPAFSVFHTKGECPERYLIDRWLHTDTEWNARDLSGWGFINFASEKLVDGDPTLRW